MKLIDKLIWMELIGPFINGMFMFLLLVFAAGSLFQATDWLVKGIPPLIVFKLVLYNLPSVVTQTFPMAMLLAGLLGFGRLSADREIVGIFAAGIHFPRTARSVVIMGALVSVIAFVWNDYLVPPASTAFWNLRTEVFSHLEKSDKPISYSIDRKDGKGVDTDVRIQGGFDSQSQTFLNVTIVKYSTDPEHSGQPEFIISCKRARPVDQTGLNWTYYDGWWTQFVPDKETDRIENFVPITFTDMKSTPQTPTPGKSFDEVLHSEITDPNRKSFKELQKEIESDYAKGRDARGKEVDLYGKLALPLASLIFGIVGAALGLNTKRGGGKTVGFGVAIFMVFLYWVFYHAMFVVGKSGGLPPMLASFLPDMTGVALGVILSIRASR
jgi:lipopolysaccharide export system permease protein